MVLPAVKLGSLVLKTLSKPFASRLKQQAGVHPKFRQLIINVAQVNHKVTTTIQRRFYGYATNVEIPPLDEEKAIQAAGDLIGELFVFSIAGAAVIFEVQRSSRSEARKEELRKQELEAIKQRSEGIAREIDLLKGKFNELQHHATGRGLAGILNFGHTHATEVNKSTAPTC